MLLWEGVLCVGFMCLIIFVLSIGLSGGVNKSGIFWQQIMQVGYQMMQSMFTKIHIKGLLTTYF